MKPKRIKQTIGIIVGSVLILSPFFAMLGTVFGMYNAFAALEGTGIADPRALSGRISSVLQFTSVGLIGFPIGVVLLVASIVSFNRAGKIQIPST